MTTNTSQFNYANYMYKVPLLLVFVMWFVYWVEIRFDFNFTNLGIYPRTGKGLVGVLTGPFIHGDTKHLFNNSIPVFVLLLALFYFYEAIAFKVLLWGALLTGVGTWLIGKQAYHIGMSGVVYLLFGFIFLSGVIRKHFRLIAVSLGVIFLYGSMFWYVFPIKNGISWEGHLSGLLVGVSFAWFFRKLGPQAPKHVFTETDFDLLFDAQGNYTPPKPEPNPENDLEEPVDTDVTNDAEVEKSTGTAHNSKEEN